MNTPKKSTGHEIAREILTPGYLGRARHRATRRKGLWNFLLFAAVVATIGISTVLLVRIADFYVQFQGSPPVFAPESPEWKRTVVACGALLVSLPIGMVLANLLIWLIPPARRALDREAVAHPGTDYRTAQRQLTYMARKMIGLYRKLIGKL